MDSLRHDLRYAIRLLGRNPLFTLTAVLSLAIGIGANSAIFTIADALLLRPPSGVVDAARVVDIGRTQEREGFDTNSYPNYLDVRARSTSFQSVSATRFEPEPMGLGTGDGAERIYGGLVSNNYFETLGARPALGRLLTSRDSETPGAAPYVVLSYRLWTRRFQQDRSVEGRQILLNGHPFTVIGVAREEFEGTTVFRPDVWVPMTMTAQAVPRNAGSDIMSREAAWLVMVARLAPGVTLERAQAELNALGAALEREYPRENRGRGLKVLPLSRVPGNEKPLAAFLAGMMVVVGLVLFIAAANVAGVLLARATSRRREIAMRLSLGATRGRIVRQMLVETVILSSAGAAGGLLLARLLTSLVTRLLPALPAPVGVSLALDWRVVAFTIGISFVAALLSGLAPALHASRADVAGWLKADAEAAPARMRLRSAFVVTQVALSIVLVVAAALFVRALQRAASIDPGFDPRGVETLSLDLSLGGYTEDSGARFVPELMQRVRAIPGVEQASTAAVLPLGGGGMGLGPLYLPGKTTERDEIQADCNIVGDGYFATLRTPIVRGRDFDTGDRAGGTRVVIVNQTMAQRLWPGEDPIGRVLMHDYGDAAGLRQLTVVGVARDGRYRTLGEAPRSFIYFPVSQLYHSRLSVVARAAGDRRLSTELRALIRQMNPALPVVMTQTLSEYASIGLLPQRIAVSISGSLGGVGLLLAMIGIYGVTAYVVTSRAREIAVRVALGAQRGDIVRMVLRQGMRLTGVGIAIGCLLAAAGSRVMASLLFGAAADPAAFAIPAVIFTLTALAACYLPARRAAGIEAAVALRSD